MCLFLYRHLRVPIDFVMGPVWIRVARWRAYQLRGMEAHHIDMASLPNMDPPTQLRLAEECGNFAQMLEEDTASG